MSEHPTPGQVAEAVAWQRDMVNGNYRDGERARIHMLAVLMAYDGLRAELDAAGPVVEVARALVERVGDLSQPVPPRVFVELLDQLAARVRAHTDTTGGAG